MKYPSGRIEYIWLSGLCRGLLSASGLGTIKSRPGALSPGLALPNARLGVPRKDRNVALAGLEYEVPRQIVCILPWITRWNVQKLEATQVHGLSQCSRWQIDSGRAEASEGPDRACLTYGPYLTICPLSVFSLLGLGSGSDDSRPSDYLNVLFAKLSDPTQMVGPAIHEAAEPGWDGQQKIVVSPAQDYRIHYGLQDSAYVALAHDPGAYI